MLITILVTLIVSLSIAQPEILRYFAEPSGWTAALCGIYLAGGAMLTIASTRSLARTLEQGRTPSSKTFRRRAMLEAGYRCWLIIGQGALIACGYAQWIQDTLGAWRVPLLDKLVLLGPFLLTVIVGWALDYRLHLALRTARTGGRAYWSRWRHVAFNVRHMLLFTLVPIAIVLLVVDVLELYLLDRAPVDMREFIRITVSIGAVITVFLFAPLILTRIWRTRRLAPGALRSDLEEICRRLHVNYRDILVWESDGVIANAAVMGLIPPVRFILVSDGIIDGMEPEYIRAVFAHEGGHVASGHLGYLMLLGVAVMTLCELAAFAAAELAGLTEPFEMLIMLTLVISVGGLLLGMVSRRFERQSDVIGAWASAPAPDNSPAITHEGAALFAGALGRIAALNGIDQNARNWRHGSIAHRIQHIIMLGSTGGTRTPIDRTVRRIKIAVILSAIAGAAAIVLQISLG